MRVLVVEDEAILALALQMCLEQEGHEVLGPAAIMNQALGLAEEARPDLALVNVNLRGGDNGVELARVLWARCRVPSFFTSGQVQEAREAQDAAWGYIRKPYAVDVVAASIKVAQALLDGRPPEKVPTSLELFVELPNP